MFKPKPFWLRWFTPPRSWVTISPYIYVPPEVEKPEIHPEIIAHEMVHLLQQTTYGKWLWLLRYVFSGSFMLSQEAEGVAAEIVSSPAGQRSRLIEHYVSMFSNKDGAYQTIFRLPCAGSSVEARAAILEALARTKIP